MNNTQTDKNKYSAPAVVKMLDLIELLSKRNDELSLNEISRLINAPINSVYRICLELEKRGYLVKNSHTGFYRLGIGFHFVGQAALNNMDIRNNALPIMKDISFCQVKSPACGHENTQQPSTPKKGKLI